MQVKLSHVGSLGALPEVVRAGAPVTPTVEVADNPHWEKLVTALAAQSAPVARLVADTLGLADAGEISILDVGGGSGVFSATWLGRNPAARSTQIDWEPINAIARRLLDVGGTAERFTCVDGDPHSTDFGTAAHDVVVYSNIAHQEGPEENVAIFAAEMLLKSKHGRTWRRADYQDWLTKAGFEDISFQPTPSPTTVVLAR